MKSQDTLRSHAPQQCELNKNKFVVVDLRQREAATILVLRGSVWVTMEGDPDDYVICAGGQLAFSHEGRLVVESLEFTHLRILLSTTSEQQFDSP